MEDIDIVGYIVRNINDTGNEEEGKEEEENTYKVEYNARYDTIDIIRHEGDKVMVYEITMETAVLITMKDFGRLIKEELDYRWQNSI